MIRLQLSKHAKKTLTKLPKKHAGQLKTKIMALLEDPYPTDSKALKGKKYQAYKLRRADSGEYRIVYAHEAGVLKVYVVAKRNDDEVYRKVATLFG